VDALLAWTVREGVTNVVRHSGARRTEIAVVVTGASASAELADDGAGPAGSGQAGGGEAGRDAGPPASGSGLAGLAERAARLGGTLLAGTGVAGGFRLRVSAPLAPAQARAAQPAEVPPAEVPPAETPGRPVTAPVKDQVTS
jgi:two-component system sensor histidine kinase DesK